MTLPEDETHEVDTEEKDKAKTQAVRLMEHAQAEYTMVTTRNGNVYAVSDAAPGPYVAIPLKGKGDTLTRRMRRRFVETYGQPPSATAVTEAVAAVEAFAEPDEPVDLPLRVDHRGNRIVLDLANRQGQAVVITPEGWEVVDRSPVPFLRSSMAEPQVVPTRGGSLDDLWGVLNVKPEDRPLFLAVLISAYFPHMARPLVPFTGEPGSAKSTSGLLALMLTDPTTATLRKPPKNEDAWKASLLGSNVIVLDNVNYLSEDMLDTLCRACTGEAIITRAMYTDEDAHAVVFRRLVILTSVELTSLRGDVADRMAPIHLTVPERRREEGEIMAAFQAARPGILGALLDEVSRVLREMPSTKVDRLPRLADFGKMAYTVAPRALEQFMHERGDLAQQVVDSSVLGAYLRELASGTLGNRAPGHDYSEGIAFDGKAADLMATLREMASSSGDTRSIQALPSTPVLLGAKISGMKANLAQVGIHVEKRTVRGYAHYRIGLQQITEGETDDR